MSLLLNMLSRLVITFLPRSKRLLISWLQSPSIVILEPRKVKSDTVSTDGSQGGHQDAPQPRQECPDDKDRREDEGEVHPEGLQGLRSINRRANSPTQAGSEDQHREA